MAYFIGTILPYITVAIFLGGLTWHLWRWTAARIPHFIALSPFPKSWAGSVGFIVWQILLFWNILKFDRRLWIGAWPMHVAIGAILGGHILGIYTLGLQFHMIFPYAISEALSESLSDLLGKTIGVIFVAAAAYLLYRRFAYDRVAAISAPSDYLHLLLLLIIGGIGVYMRFVPGASLHYDEARHFLAGLFLFRPEPLPDNVFFLLHFLFVQILMIIFPFSKLMHPFGMLWNRWVVNRPYEEPAMGIPGAQIVAPAGVIYEDSGRTIRVEHWPRFPVKGV